MTASVHNECFRRQHRFDIFKEKESLCAVLNQTRSRCIEHNVCALDLRSQRWDPRVVCCTRGPPECSVCIAGPETSNREARNYQFVGGLQCGRESTWIQIDEYVLGFVHTPDQEQA